LAETARSVPGCFGSRLTGAGFGGCTVSLVADSMVPRFEQQVSEAYLARTGRQALLYVCRPVDGVRQLHPKP
jgi:galactokinase